jgi:hypothetical protein
MGSHVITKTLQLYLILLSLYSIEARSKCFKKLSKCILLSDVKKEIINCKLYASNNSRKSSNTLMYRCDCRYLIQQKPDDFDEKHLKHIEIECLNKTEILAPNCVEIHTGMAINGYNLIYHKWTDRDTCFNKCLNVKVENGFRFDCKSFEHWHTNCPYDNNRDNMINKSNGNCSKLSIESEKNSPINALDLCVLSNQTIGSEHGRFAPNYGVTYYEKLCNGKVTLFNGKVYLLN